MKTHYDKFLKGVSYCGRQNYDSATDKKSEVTCKDCIRIIKSMQGVNWKALIKRELKAIYGDRVFIKFDAIDNPSLVFKYDDESKNFKQQVISYATDLFDKYGGEVRFFLEKEYYL